MQEQERTCHTGCRFRLRFCFFFFPRRWLSHREKVCQQEGAEGKKTEKKEKRTRAEEGSRRKVGKSMLPAAATEGTL